MRRIAILALLAVGACAMPMTEPRQFVVYFLTDDPNLTKTGHEVVEQIAAAARDTNPSKIQVEGEAGGAAPADRTLASGRADTVIHEMIAAGVNGTIIEKKAIVVPAEPLSVSQHQVNVRFLP
jgi:outer membrane protein OmpA-like peptidoglycan-associated protein